jgi:ArsR family transcriptional regulator
MCKVFSNATRLKLLNLLRDGEGHSVSEMQKSTGLGQANLSQHLGIMRQRGILLHERKGRNVLYRISNPKITDAFDIIRSVLTDSINARERILHESR